MRRIVHRVIQKNWACHPHGGATKKSTGSQANLEHLDKISRQSIQKFPRYFLVLGKSRAANANMLNVSICCSKTVLSWKQSCVYCWHKTADLTLNPPCNHVTEVCVCVCVKVTAVTGATLKPASSLKHLDRVIHPKCVVSTHSRLLQLSITSATT